MDVVGTKYFIAVGDHPERAVGSHRGIGDCWVEALHREFRQLVAFLGLD
jgi:hypothetical protein